MTTNYNIRLEKSLKESAFKVFDSYGLTPSQAIKLFLNQVAQTQVIPLSFDWKRTNIPNTETENAISQAREEFTNAKRYNSLYDALLEMKRIANE